MSKPQDKRPDLTSDFGVLNAQNKDIYDATSKAFHGYQDLMMIAEGGMGVVYKGWDEKAQRFVAIKMLSKRQFATKEEIERFQKEYRVAANLEHPGIVKIYEVGEFNDIHYYVMAYMEGGSLKDMIKNGPLAPLVATRIVKQVAQAVQFAHDNNIVHRDLKPDNVLLDHLGQPQVADFGLVKRLDKDSDLTKTGYLLGTPNYMSPEQSLCLHDQVGKSSDVYSLGAILYCLLIGRPPFAADNVVDTLQQVVHQQPVPLRMLNKAIPKDLETICLKCLEKEPRYRFSSAQDFADELDRVLEGLSVKTLPVSTIMSIIRWYLRNPMGAQMTAGGYATLMGALLILWAAMGIIFNVFGFSTAPTEAIRLRMLLELVLLLLFLWTPLFVSGLVSISGRQYSLWIGFAFYALATPLCVMGAFGIETSFMALQLNEEISKSPNVRLQYFTLISIMSIIGLLCHLSAILSLFWRRSELRS